MLIYHIFLCISTAFQVHTKLESKCKRCLLERATHKAEFIKDLFLTRDSAMTVHSGESCHHLSLQCPQGNSVTLYQHFPI